MTQEQQADLVEAVILDSNEPDWQEVQRAVAAALNSKSVDNYLNIPDYKLAELVTTFLQVLKERE